MCERRRKLLWNLYDAIEAADARFVVHTEAAWANWFRTLRLTETFSDRPQNMTVNQFKSYLRERIASERTRSDDATMAKGGDS
jgi:alpha-L-fucosidase